MTPQTSIRGLPGLQPALHLLAGSGVLAGLIVIGLHNYLLFHALVESFSVFVACSIFLIGWKMREYTDSAFLPLLATAYLSVASLDLLHMLSYKGMGILAQTGANIPTQLWIAARYIEAITLAVAPWMLKTAISRNFFVPVYAAVTAGLIAGIFFLDAFPVFYVQGRGLTGFKIASEYVVIALLLAATTSIYANKGDINSKVLHLLLGSIVLTIFAELSFTFYVSVYGISNFVGHIFKLLSYYLLYKALVESAVINPARLLKRNANLEFKVNRAVHELSQSYLASRDLSFDDFTARILEKARELTGSELGFAGYLDRETGNLVCPTMAGKIEDRCEVQDKSPVFESFNGMWGWVLRKGHTLISNQPEIDPRGCGLPEGHLPIRNFMAAPAKVGNAVSGIIAMANSPSGFTNRDARVLEQLTDFYSSALLRNRHEEAIKAREKKLRSITEAALDGVVMLDVRGRIVEWNTAAERIFGIARQEALGRDFVSMAVPERFRQSVADDLRNLEAGHPLSSGEGLQELAVLRKGGDEVAVEMNLSLLQIEGKGYVIFFVRDVSLRKDLESSVDRQNQQLSNLIQDTYTGMVVVDKNGFVQFANTAAEHLLGRSMQELSGTELGIPAMEGQEADLNIVRPDGSLGSAAAYATETLWEGEPASIIMLHDITDRKKMEESLEHLAKFDSLTDLPNRYMLLDRLKESIRLARHNKQRLGIVSLDLDRFKGINDWLGHASGDEMLAEVGRRLTGTLRSTDTVARMGGDEFIILLENVVNAENAQLVCEKIIRAMQAPVTLQGQEIIPACSLGFCLYPDHGTDPDTLLQRADAAMYEAKENGRGQIRPYSSDVLLDGSARKKLEQELRRAINNDEFVLVYQPQYELQSGRLSGLEALLRWNHPERGMVSPGEFIPMLEETNLILPAGNMVLRKAANQAKRWQDAGLQPPRIAVNLSARQLYSKDLLEEVAQSVRESGLSPDRLVIELTETAVMRNMDIARKNLQALQDLGMRIALDDFGKGYSTLHVLTRIPVDVVKIDRSFIQGIPEDKEKAALVEAILTMAHGLDKRVVAEGIEHAGQNRWLIRMGCDHVQGFHFSYPLPPQQTEALLRAECSRQRNAGGAMRAGSVTGRNLRPVAENAED